MQRPKIALFGDNDSEQVRWLAGTVEREGGTPGIFDIQLCGAGGSRVSYGQDMVAWDGESFDDVRAVHIRCISPNTLPTLPPVLNERTHNEWRNQFLREQELQAATYGFFDTLANVNPAAIPDLMAATFSPMDLLFYGIAVYEGFKLSFRRITHEEIRAAITGVPAGI